MTSHEQNVRDTFSTKLLYNFVLRFWNICSFQRTIEINKMVGLSGLEPPTSCLSGTRSNHLSYRPVSVVEIKRLELLTPCVQSRCSPN